MNALKGGITSAFGGGGDGLLGSFGGFFAGGGTLGAGKWGIAGEFGPEIIKGPAQVIPINMLGERGGGGSAPVINITNNVDASGADAANVARLEAALVRSNRELEGRVIQAIRKANQSNVKFG